MAVGGEFRISTEGGRARNFGGLDGKNTVHDYHPGVETSMNLKYLRIPKQRLTKALKGKGIYMICRGTLQGPNISHPKGTFEHDFSLPKVGYVSSLEGI